MAAMTTTYTGHMQGKFIYDGSKTLDDMMNSLLEDLQMLKEMKEAGVQLVSEVDNDFAFLMTDDPAVAKRFGLKAIEAAED